ncbi:DUF2798 domain-containing protein [Photobacterium sp. DNB23_23_1]|uniref:DUF2798 domain-containing protein n=1 Tax=Photobacterium pectinilyticum TaxID=2906793 RepID=A0ABT1N2K4_9GAMM|nr:DUF2798 domain-containing protein [Photobacterium sp. ZSDE20]MCQ1058970.1 DUF2798 domain-containing protein [Photobacterium sp. ZSDE20]MDD1824015.1 DUF2798 domain-containing protein [Photobacterium sp. ZSDE20]
MTAEATMTAPLPTQTKTPLIYKILVVLGMMTLMGGTLTGVMTYMNVGFTDTFLIDWLTSFLKTVLVMMPVGMVMMTLVTKLVTKLMPNASEHKRNLVVGLNMAVIMESIMAFTTTANNIGFSDLNQFTHSWLQGFFAALPIGLTLITLISLTIKPKIERFLKS